MASRHTLTWSYELRHSLASVLASSDVTNPHVARQRGQTERDFSLLFDAMAQRSHVATRITDVDAFESPRARHRVNLRSLLIHAVHHIESTRSRRARAYAAQQSTPDDVLQALRAFQPRQRGERLRLGRTLQRTDHVLANEIGRPVSPEWFSSLWRANVKAAGLPPVRLHDARHITATFMRIDGMPFVTAAG